VARKTDIGKLLKKRIFILDGATGTELQKRGMPAGVCPETWCLEHPDTIKAVHADYYSSGADAVYTCTFGANRIKLAQYDVTHVADINRKLARIARDAAGSQGLVAGDIGPTGQFVRPFGQLPFEDAVAIFREQVRGLVDGGVDFFVIETMMDIQEARAALIAVRELTEAFTLVTMTYEAAGRTLNGTDPVSALVTLQSLGADAVGCNCSTGPEEMIDLIACMKPYSTVPLVAKPNAGMPELVNNETVFTMQPADFASFGPEFVAKGAALLGGCCGTTPAHIRALKEAVAGFTPGKPVRKALSAVSSARTTVAFDTEAPLFVIGERINPTGKKAFQEELRAGTMTLLRQMAREQEEKGAHLLDVNVGAPGVAEDAAMEAAVELLATATSLPLVIDSSSLSVMEKALRLYPGRALINSISGEKKKLERLLPLAAKYGAMCILLPLTDRGVPETAKERRKIIEAVYDAARSYGLRKDDFIIDGLVMAASANPNAPREALKTIEWVSTKFKCRTLLGLTNVSFGMPERKWLNAAFLAMAIDRGLTAAILNPAVDELMHIGVASDLIANRDRDAAGYLTRFAVSPKAEQKAAVPQIKAPPERVARAIIDGTRDEIDAALERAVASGGHAGELVRSVMIPAITEVGELYERKEYFLPQLIASAETMKRGLAYLEPYLKADEAHGEKKGRILIATVKGDIHDIGKNIISLMLNNHGFEIIDLGKDVAAHAIITEIRRSNPAIVALSALMTTTMVNMKEVVDMVRKEGLTCRFLVGGAVVTETYANEIGAHYASDGVEAIRVAEQLMEEHHM